MSMQLEEYRRVNKEQKEHIEILNKELNEVMAEATDIENKYYELQDKYKRLNNIINELEKMLEQTIENSAVQSHIEMAEYTLKELKELKGSE